MLPLNVLSPAREDLSVVVAYGIICIFDEPKLPSRPLYSPGIVNISDDIDRLSASGDRANGEWDTGRCLDEDHPHANQFKQDLPPPCKAHRRDPLHPLKC